MTTNNLENILTKNLNNTLVEKIENILTEKIENILTEKIENILTEKFNYQSEELTTSQTPIKRIGQQMFYDAKITKKQLEDSFIQMFFYSQYKKHLYEELGITRRYYQKLIMVYTYGGLDEYDPEDIISGKKNLCFINDKIKHYNSYKNPEYPVIEVLLWKLMRQNIIKWNEKYYFCVFNTNTFYAIADRFEFSEEFKNNFLKQMKKLKYQKVKHEIQNDSN